MTSNTWLRSTDGLALEAAIDEAADPEGIVVFCHPHPKMGGTMNAPLLVAVTAFLNERAWEVVRFNFRGIGASEGDASTGEAEVADARGALAFARTHRPRLPLALMGWSFGGAVALRTAALEPDLRACIAIAPAITPKPGITAGVPPARELDVKVPLLVVCGANDQQVEADACRAWAREAGAEYIEMRGANHFFWAKYDDLAGAVAGYLARQLPR